MTKPALVPSTQEEFEAYQFPATYCNDIVAHGHQGKNDQGTDVTWVTKLHVVKTNGKVVCKCDLNPVTVYNFPAVQSPPDFRTLFCEESNLYMRTEVTRLKSLATPTNTGDTE